jgi:septum formation protein
MGIAHNVLLVPSPPGEDEPAHPGERAADYVVRTARDKLDRAVHWVPSQDLPELPILAADTTVILDDQILGKPCDSADAHRILSGLSGRKHEVRTAIAVWTGKSVFEAISVTTVSMRHIEPEEIDRYCESGEPYGKAGAYGIQGLAGAFIERIEGSYSGVMGLPVFETAGLLRRAGIRTA